MFGFGHGHGRKRGGGSGRGFGRGFGPGACWSYYQAHGQWPWWSRRAGGPGYRWAVPPEEWGSAEPPATGEVQELRREVAELREQIDEALRRVSK